MRNQYSSDNCTEYTGYGCIEHIVYDKIGLVIAERTINSDERFNDIFFRSLLRQLNKKTINFHPWVENPTVDEILGLQYIKNKKKWTIF